MKVASRSTIVRILALLMIFALAAGATPALATRVFEAKPIAFNPQLKATPAPKTVEKITQELGSVAAVVGSRPAAKASAPEPRPAQVRSTVGAGSVTLPSQGQSENAQAILASYKSRYPILQGVTVQFGDARGFQAIAYYKSGRIVICPNHDASLERIINHEVWHIIDWRDNNRIDWGENIPPKNASSYAR